MFACGGEDFPSWILNGPMGRKHSNGGVSRNHKRQVQISGGAMITLPPQELQVPCRWDYWAFSVLQNPPWPARNSLGGWAYGQPLGTVGMSGVN